MAAGFVDEGSKATGSQCTIALRLLSARARAVVLRMAGEGPLRTIRCRTTLPRGSRDRWQMETLWCKRPWLEPE